MAHFGTDGVLTQAEFEQVVRTATKVVAASDSSASSQGLADYVCDGIADDVQIQAAIDAVTALGVEGGLVQLSEGNFNLTSVFTLSKGIRFKGQGKSATRLTLGADITPFTISNIYDVEISELLIIVNAAQTNPIIKLIASTSTMGRNNFRAIQISSSTQIFTAIELSADGAWGIWNNHFDDIAVSGSGVTVVKLHSNAVSAWINFNYFNNFYVMDALVGIDIVYSAGAGSNSNRFSNWGVQCGAGTIFGLRIPNSAIGYNADTTLYCVDFVDMPAAGKYFSIGTGVKGTRIIGGTYEMQDYQEKYVDNGVDTKIVGLTDYGMQLVSEGNLLAIPTLAGWSEGVGGSGSTNQYIYGNQVRTGVTLNSSARLYTTSQLFGFDATSFVNFSFDKEIIFIFNYARSASEANAIARVQIKAAATEGALGAKGIGIEVDNFALYGESYGTSLAKLDLSTVLVADHAYQIMIKFYPASRIEWWVDSVIKGTQSTAVKIPTGSIVAYIVHSIITTISNPSADAQSYVMQPKIWTDR